MIPTPRYVVFYNGQDKDLPDKVVQKLSDSFENPKDSDGFEWTATITATIPATKFSMPVFDAELTVENC